MMMLALLLASAPSSAPQDAPIVSEEDEIVVIGKRLRGWKANIRETSGVWQCKTLRTTGDAEIDVIGCAAMTDCYPVMKPRLVALSDKSLAAAQRKADYKAVSRDLTTCVMAKRKAGIAALAKRRSMQ